jgi:predicted phage tail component-like protein
MTTPVKLNGAMTTVMVNGIDLHTMGMVVNQVQKSPPAARDSSLQINGKDGDFDFTNRYGARTIVISGVVVGDSNPDCASRIDAIKSFFKLKDNKGAFQVVFQNEADRYWTCRYQSLEITGYTSWLFSHSVLFSLVLKCVKPYAESTSFIVSNLFLHSQKDVKIANYGTYDTPFMLKMSQRFYPNLLESVRGETSEDYTLWTFDNATGSDETTIKVYGAGSIKTTRMIAGAYYATINVTPAIDTAKYYIIGVSCLSYPASTGALEAVITGGTNLSTPLSLTGLQNWSFAFLKISPDDLAGMTDVEFRVSNDGTADHFFIDGAFIYEITEDEYDDDDYFPPPYQSDTAGDDFVPPANPSLILHRNKNLYKCINGDTTGWEEIADGEVSTICDPYNINEKCLLISTKANYDACKSGIIYLTPGKYYQFTFDYYIENMSGTFDIAFRGYSCETGDVYYRTLAKITGPAENLFWTNTSGSETINFLIPFDVNAVRLFIYQDGAGYGKIYIKNIQIVEVSAIDDAAVGYQKPDIKKITYTGSIADKDTLIIDNENFVANYFLYASNSVGNGLAALSGESLVLAPGENTLRYEDFRLSSSNPETASCGSIKCAISYRARYL